MDYKTPRSIREEIDRIVCSGLSDAERKTALNRIRLKVMLHDSFYSRARQEVDSYIRRALKTAAESHTESHQGKGGEVATWKKSI